MNKASLSILIITLFIYSCQKESKTDHQYEFIKLTDSFCKGVRNLNIPSLKRGYIENLQGIKNLDSIQMQLDFFQKSNFVLQTINKDELSEDLQLDYDLIEYEISINKERLHLEREYAEGKIEKISKKGIFFINDSKKWYSYFLKKWLNDNVAPEALYKQGIQDVKTVKEQIKNIRNELEFDSVSFYRHLNNDEFFYNNPKKVELIFNEVHKRVLNNYANIFPYSDLIPELNIKQGTNESLKIVPAFYQKSDSTFYYNLFDHPFNKRQASWLYLHEAVPGHHYQLSIDKSVKKSPLKQLFTYYGYAEGWAAYVEEIGKELNAYSNEYDYLGKCEWDLVRSVRVVIDVGINYYGWTDDQAFSFWKKHIPNQNHIAKREIERIKKWPVQVITYKYGSNKFLKWYNAYSEKQGNMFNTKEFHKKILENGSLPFPVLEKHIFHEKDTVILNSIQAKNTN